MVASAPFELGVVVTFSVAVVAVACPLVVVLLASHGGCPVLLGGGSGGGCPRYNYYE